MKTRFQSSVAVHSLPTINERQCSLGCEGNSGQANHVKMTFKLRLIHRAHLPFGARLILIMSVCSGLYLARVHGLEFWRTLHWVLLFLFRVGSSSTCLQLSRTRRGGVLCGMLGCHAAQVLKST